MKIFVSVGTGLSPEQDKFVAAIEDRLRAEGLEPHTIDRNTFSASAPLVSVTELMNECSGTVVIALERYFGDKIVERRNTDKALTLEAVAFPTPWNQIEAALAYCLRHPLLVIVADNVKADGLLEPGYDWYVQRLPIDERALHSPAFSGILANWSRRVREHKRVPRVSPYAARAPDRLAVIALFSGLPFLQRLAIFSCILFLILAAFVLGQSL